MSKIDKRHYYCDYCGKELTDIRHLHFEGVYWVGIVKPPKFQMNLNGGAKYFDFCNIESCFTKFVLGKKKGAKK